MYIFQNSPRELEKLFLLAKSESCFQWDDDDDDNDDDGSFLLIISFKKLLFCFSYLSNYPPVSHFHNLFCWKLVSEPFYNTKNT